MRPWRPAALALLLALPASADSEKQPPPGPAERGAQILQNLIERTRLTGRERAQLVRQVDEIIARLPRDLSRDFDQAMALISRYPPKVQQVAKIYIERAIKEPDIRPRPRSERREEREPREQPPKGWDVRRRLAHENFRRDPKDPDANTGVGIVYFGDGDFRRAQEHFERAYRSGERSPELLNYYAGAAYHAGDYARAMEIAAEALRRDPGNQNALALYQFSKGRLPAGPAALPASAVPLGGAVSDGAVAVPARTPAALAPDPAAGAHPPGGTIAAANQAAVDAQARSSHLTKEAGAALHVRDPKRAYQLASRAVEENPRNAQALNLRAISLVQMRRYADAVADSSAALALVPENDAVLQTRASAFAHDGRYAEALADAETTLRRSPQNAFAHRNRAHAKSGLGDRAGALDALREAARLDARFQAEYERALQVPQDADLSLLFAGEARSAPAAAAAAPAPGSARRRFLRLAALTASGGLLIALGLLHIVSASWRERVRRTVRRVLGPAPAGAAGASAAAAAPGGAFWTQYELVKEIGLGGMGVVYEARDRSLERRVAVKKMRDEIRLDAKERRNFVNEARLVAQLHHPNIVDIYAIVEDGAELYLVFEFVEGRTLHDALRSAGAFDLERARRATREISSALEHAHERKIIHRDLKPSNIMLLPDGRIKVMDFGVARQAKEALTKHSMTNTVVGTPPYMAPEQEQGTVRRESDVYAMGVCLYEMLTGALPFTGTGAAMLLNKLNGKHVPLSQRSPSFPPALDAVLAKALAPDPDQRYRRPSELADALDGVAAARAA